MMNLSSPITRLSPIDWEPDLMAKGKHVPVTTILKDLHNGRSANPEIAAWLNHHGFPRQEDGASGYIHLVRKEGKALAFEKFRLRVCTPETGVELSPSIARGGERKPGEHKNRHEMIKLDGHILVFTEQMPHPHLWLVRIEQVEKWRLDKAWKSMSKTDKNHYLLDKDYSGTAPKVYDGMLKAWASLNCPDQELTYVEEPSYN